MEQRHAMFKRVFSPKRKRGSLFGELRNPAPPSDPVPIPYGTRTRHCKDSVMLSSRYLFHFGAHIRSGEFPNPLVGLSRCSITCAVPIRTPCQQAVACSLRPIFFYIVLSLHFIVS